jgi:hypothetical protein
MPGQNPVHMHTDRTYTLPTLTGFEQIRQIWWASSSWKIKEMGINLFVRQLVFNSSETAVGILINSMDPELIGSSIMYAAMTHRLTK